MLLQAASSSRAPSFLALDPKLPLLAARAAVEIDNFLVHQENSERHASLDAVEQLLNLIENAPFATANGGDSSKGFSDPISNAILERAFDSSLKKNADATASLRSTVKTLSSQLSDPKQTDKQFLTAFRDFFLTLSIAASNTRSASVSDRFKHSHKR